MKVLALDISTKTGWSVFETDGGSYPGWVGNGVSVGDYKLRNYGLIKLPKPVCEYGEYPENYCIGTGYMAKLLMDLVWKENPNEITIEETNKGQNRYSQKVLEFIHCAILNELGSAGYCGRIKYINSSEWRKVLGLTMSKMDKVNNKKLKVAKKLAEATNSKLDRAKLGIRGAVTKKHVAVRYVNETFNLSFKIKDNDIADSICLGTAYIKGARTCDGK